MLYLKRFGPLAAMTLLAVAVACGGGSGTASAPAEEQAANGGDASGPQAPMFAVDPLWPKPLPNHWLLGSTIGVDVDTQDHVWIVHRASTLAANETSVLNDPPTAEECCIPAPPVLEFDPEGNLVGHWGGPGEGYDWPSSNHGITIDHMDNVWVGGNGGGDSHALKFTRGGEFLLQVGVAGRAPDSLSLDSFGRIAKIAVDGEANEIYFADGYFNKRIAVVDADTGELKRYWGAYGNEPDDDYDFGGPYREGNAPAQQFRGPVHCGEISNDGLVYVCDRAEDRVQVFQKDGTFVQEVLIATHTLSQGSTWDIDFSPDPEQQFLYLADGQNMKVYIIERETMEVLTAFGDGGRQPGMFFAVHSIAVDSDGNIYTTETYEGSRLQKFTFKGYAPVPAGAEGENSQGVLWPSSN